MMTPQLQEALEWVNHLRTGPLGSPPMDELPKGVPGHTKECVIARALKLGILGNVDVLVNNATHMVQVQSGPLLQGSNPSVVQEMIRQFDAGELRHLIDFDTFNRMNPHGHQVHQALAKPFDKLLPKLAQFYPELQLTPHSTVEVAQTFDSQLHVVTVKNPGECPKAVELTATMVAHMQKHLEQEMEKMLYPPMLVVSGKLEPLKYTPGNLMPITASEVVQLKSQYYAPDWANMMKTPEAPVMAPIEEPAVV